MRATAAAASTVALKIGFVDSFIAASQREGHLEGHAHHSEGDGEDEIMWGDCGVGNFFISSDDLKRLDFSRVLYTWDCC